MKLYTLVVLSVMLCVVVGALPGTAQPGGAAPQGPVTGQVPAVSPKVETKTQASPEEKKPAKEPEKRPAITFQRDQEPLDGKVASLNELFATYTARLDGTTIPYANNPGVGLPIPPVTVRIDPTNFSSYTIAHNLLLAIRRAALPQDKQTPTQDKQTPTQDKQTPTQDKQTPREMRKLLGRKSYWASVLYPHGSVWPWRWQWGYKDRRLGYRRERQHIFAFENRLAQLVDATWHKQPITDLSAPTAFPGPQVSRLSPDNPGEAVPVIVGDATRLWVRRQNDPNNPGNSRIELLSMLTPPSIIYQQPGFWKRSSPPTASTVMAELWKSPVLAAARQLQATLATVKAPLKDTLVNLVKTRPWLPLDEVPTLTALARKASDAEKDKKKLPSSAKSSDTKRAETLYSAASSAFNGAYKALSGAPKGGESSLRNTLQNISTNSGLEAIDFAGWRKFRQTAPAANWQFAQTMASLQMSGQEAAAAPAPAPVLVPAVVPPLVVAAPDPAASEESSPLYASLKKAVAQLLDQPEALQPKPAGSASNLLYTGQLLLPTSPSRRVARLFVYDRGNSTGGSNRARYAVCLQYNATDGTFQDTPDAVAECTVPVGYVGVSTELVALERSQMVEALYGKLVDKMAALVTRGKSQTDSAQAQLMRKQIIPRLTLPVTPKPDTTKPKQDTTSKPNISELAAKENVVVQTKEELSLRESLRDFYDDLVRHQEQLAEAPRSGTVLLGHLLAIYQMSAASSWEQDGPPLSGRLFEVDSVSIEVEDGSAMGIKAYGRVGTQQMLFETYAPLNLSSDYDLQNQWYRQRMFAQSSQLTTYPDRGLYLHLHELMRYYPQLLARSSDRSPANGIYVFRPQDPIGRRILRKDPTSKLLQARVYSDLAGLAGDRPNGLIQLEVSKKFILYNRSTVNRTSQIGFLNYIHPFVALNKIEENNSRLPYRHEGLTVGRQFPRERTVRTIDLLRYTNLRVGFAQNLGIIRLPVFKSDIALDYRIELSRVPVRDTIGALGTPRAAPRDSTLNLVTYGPQLVWRVRPDSRFGAQFSVGIVIQKQFNTTAADTVGHSVTQVKEDYGPGPGSNGHTVLGHWFRTNGQTLLQYEILMWAHISENSQLFFRTRFSQLRYATYQTFFQLQIGYQFDVFTNRRTAVTPSSLFPQ